LHYQARMVLAYYESRSSIVIQNVGRRL
jgi:hypothetical protein